ncbi:MAG: hypothetical protein KAY24_19125, partial [Candidatus Eisenbacteria sp.]|nr:hypothetical protein [Candidatus Eisenbacteria bacterium]
VNTKEPGRRIREEFLVVVNQGVHVAVGELMNDQGEQVSMVSRIRVMLAEDAEKNQGAIWVG